jgi:hypothetical protein
MDPSAQRAAELLAWELGSRKSVEVRVTCEITNYLTSAEKPQAFDRVVEHYIETASGQRFCDYRGMKGDKVVSRSTHYADGKKFADVNYSPNDPDQQASVYIKRTYWMEEASDRRQAPQPLLFLYVGRHPLNEALSKAEAMGKQEVIGRKCDVFRFPRVQWTAPQDQVFYLDTATAIPLKVEAYRVAADRDGKEPLGVWSAESLDQVHGHFVTMKSNQTEYGKDGTPTFMWKYNVESIEFDKTYNSSMFWPTLQPGVTVFDAVANKIREVPGGSRAQPTDLKGSVVSPTPVRATPPGDWTAFGSVAAFLIGVAILIMGGVLWRRQR